MSTSDLRPLMRLLGVEVGEGRGGELCVCEPWADIKTMKVKAADL